MINNTIYFSSYFIILHYNVILCVVKSQNQLIDRLFLKAYTKLKIVVTRYDDDNEYSTNYKLISKQLASLIEDEKNLIAILSNTSALLNDTIDHINCRFYLIENKELILGPFQGHPACVHIAIGKGFVALPFHLVKYNVLKTSINSLVT